MLKGLNSWILNESVYTDSIWLFFVSFYWQIVQLLILIATFEFNIKINSNEHKQALWNWYSDYKTAFEKLS